MRVQPLGQEDPLEEGKATHSSIPPGESHGQRSLADYSPQGHKELDLTEATQHMWIKKGVQTETLKGRKEEVAKCLK